MTELSPKRRGIAVPIIAGVVGATLGAGIAAVAENPGSAKPTYVATGVARCAGGQAVSGLWIETGDKTHGFVAPQAEPNDASIAAYSKPIDTATYTIHIGCGTETLNGKSGQWAYLGYLPVGETLASNVSLGVECPNNMHPNPYHNTCQVSALMPFDQPEGFLPTAGAIAPTS